MGIFYLILVWLELESMKLKKKIMPTFNRFVVQNNPIMQLCLIFHKTLNKNKLKV